MNVKNRQSLRLKHYDYSKNGAYFVTICTQNRTCFFGEIINATMKLNEPGEMIQCVWEDIPTYYSGFEIDEFKIMPNHIHGILMAVEPIGYNLLDIKNQSDFLNKKQAKLSLPDIIHRFKTITTKKYIDGVKQHNWQRFEGKLWQRNYYEHIIRSEWTLYKTREYIINNPINWHQDKMNPIHYL